MSHADVVVRHLALDQLAHASGMDAVAWQDIYNLGGSGILDTRFDVDRLVQARQLASQRVQYILALSRALVAVSLALEAALGVMTGFNAAAAAA
jgi:hypothetical protein